jgi:hypothetical protein
MGIGESRQRIIDRSRLPTTANVARGKEEHFMPGFDIGFALRHCDAQMQLTFDAFKDVPPHARGGRERAA